MTNTEKNKIIAIFDGFQFGNVRGWITGDRPNMFYKKNEKGDIVVAHTSERLKYHSSWDWLMPVVQKVLSTDTGTLDVYSLYVEDSLRTADIKTVYQATVDFIEYWNERKQTK